MPLEPRTRALVDGMAEQNAPTFDQVSLHEGREQIESFTALQSAPEPVERVTDMLVPGAAGQLTARVYHPAGVDEGSPLLVHFHGGGWAAGSIRVSDGPLRKLANATRSIVATVDYRLAPETRFPGPLEDCYAALHALAERAGELGAHPERVMVIGDSAGGNLAAAVSLLARDRDGPHVSGQVLLYPVTAPAEGSPYSSYYDNAAGYGLTRAEMLRFWELYIPDSHSASDPYAAPLYGELHDLPPALVLTAEFDPLRDEGEAYGERLRDAGNEVVVTRYDGVIHGFFWMPGTLDVFEDALTAIAEFLDKRIVAAAA